MTNREIINFIARYCAQKEDFDGPQNTDLVFTMLAHGYLYVRPGELTKKFISGVLDALKVGACNGLERYRVCDFDYCTLGDWMRIYMAKEALNVAREAFDETYFKRQISSLDPDEECDESLLNKYLKLMDKKQLLGFLNMWVHATPWFLSSELFVYDELYECCCPKDPSLTNEWNDYSWEEPPYFMTDYLSNEEIIDVIEDAIVHKSIAGHLARRFYDTGDIDDIHPYIYLNISYEFDTGRDIYNPEIFDDHL